MKENAKLHRGRDAEMFRQLVRHHDRDQTNSFTGERDTQRKCDRVESLSRKTVCEVPLASFELTTRERQRHRNRNSYC